MIRHGQRGFIVTLGLIILLTVVFIGLFVGIASVRDAWFKKASFDTSVDVYVLDAKGKVLGKSVDFDEHETPLVPFVDYSLDNDPGRAVPDYVVPNTSGEPTNYRVLVGVRDDRFTTRERIYYPDTKALNCTGTPCIFEPSTESSVTTDGGVLDINSQGLDEIPGTGGVSYQLATQAGGGPGTVYNYGVGASDGGVIPGLLYRQTDIDCPLDLPDTITEKLYMTYWQSQRVVETGGGPATTPPCYKFLVAEPGETIAAIKCKPGALVHKSPDFCVGADEVGGVLPYCRTVVDDPNDDTGTHRCAQDATKTAPADPNWGGDGFAACPDYPGTDDDWTLNPPKNASGFCCPPGTKAGGAGQCQQASKAFAIEAGVFLQAEEVLNPYTGNNILEDTTPPFKVNLPINPDGWQATAPDGEGTP